MKPRIFVLIIVCILPFIQIKAQSDIAKNQYSLGTITPERLFYLDSMQWLSTNNAAAIGIERPEKFGIVSAVYQIEEGDFKKAEEAPKNNNLNLRSYGYASTQNLHLFGLFSYSQDAQYQRRWMDETGYLEGNPLLTGSDIPGDYTQQLFNSEVTVASKQLFNLFWSGINLKYTNGDLSRTRDPRSRVQLLDLQLYPSLIFKLSKKNLIGINLFYKYTKEKQLSLVSKEENFDKYTYYLLKGLVDYSTTSILGFSRNTYSNTYGLETQFSHSSSKYDWKFIVGWNKRFDVMNEALKYIPGDYSETKLRAALNLAIRNRKKTDKLKLGYESTNGESKTYIQELNTETGEDGIVRSKWRLITSYPSYLNSQNVITLRWKRYYQDKQGRDVRVLLNSELNYHKSKRMNIHPESEELFSHLSALTNCLIRIYNGNTIKFYLEPHLGLAFKLNNSLNIHNSILTGDKTVIIKEIVEPNHSYYTSNKFYSGLDLCFQTRIAKQQFMFNLNSDIATNWTLNTHRYLISLSLSLLL